MSDSPIDSFKVTNGPLSKGFRANWTHVHRPSEPGTLPPFTLVINARDLTRFVEREGFRNSGRGKGSHSVFRKSGCEDITIPQR
jgi:hypothetical protein